MNSDCTQSLVRDYFFTGAVRSEKNYSCPRLTNLVHGQQLPESGVVCPTDQALFPPNITIVSVNAVNLG